ncbi:hypothetical protein HYH02_012819 [Chlamydomonas schloesseri]|uniref:U-box domain-containing protein n=1 Tax=Chlamydomonas schloesseri TaxID=2026947 RepID=A0A835STL9_9CHLO|nr:hypothetical protein HYH02_012819 [Chlamydomonas schloesseri]|eukprot:KAG2433117.1 hypothetical protein HYH02_012819 [Chlamydomonas schloesseri]
MESTRELIVQASSLALHVSARATDVRALRGADGAALADACSNVGTGLSLVGRTSRLRAAPVHLFEALVTSLEMTLCVLDASGVAASAASVLLIAGPVLQRLRESMGDVAAALGALAAAVEASLRHRAADEGSEDSDDASSAVSLLRTLRRELLGVPLAGLEERVVGCEALRSRLRSLAETQAGEAAVEEAVRAALLHAGVPASRLRNPEARSELVAELFDLQSHSAAQAPADSSSSSAGGRAAAAAAGPLLSAADCDWVGTVASALLYTPAELQQQQQQQLQQQQQRAAGGGGQLSGAGPSTASGAWAAAAPVPAPAHLNGSVGSSSSIVKTPAPPDARGGGAAANGGAGASSSSAGAAACNSSSYHAGAEAGGGAGAPCNAGCAASSAGKDNGAAAADGEAAAGAAAGALLLPLQRSLLCPITQLLMRDPVTTSAGHTYERCAIEAWFLNNNTDPTTRQLLTSKELIPSWTVKGAIEEWLAAAGLSHDQYDDLGDGGAAVFGLDGPGLRFILGSGSGNGNGAAAAGRNGGGGGVSEVAAPGSSAAYGAFAGSTWEQVAEADEAARNHLQAAGVSAAVARALTDKLGAVTMKELREGAVSETHVLGLGLKALDQRRLLQALVAAAGRGAAGASGAGGKAAAAGAAAGVPATAVATARLMDYVTVSPGWRTEADAAGGPLAPGRYGIVLMDDRSDDKPLKVRSLQEPYRVWWYTRAALTPVPAASVPLAWRLELPVDEDNMGAPVTPWTSEPGMLVRRGYDWRNAADRQGQGGEVGMLAESRECGRMWRVFWSNGGEGVYATGHDDKYELQHLQVHPFSGAPVVDDAALTPGCGVVRGLHWTYENQDGGTGTIGSVQHDDRDGYVAALWPNHRLARYRASTQHGFDLHYCSRPGEPVTLFNAQAGLKVTRGRDWKWESQDSDGSVGVMIRPSLCAEEGMWWQVAWANGARNQYRVGRPGSAWCDLQVATYESNGDSGRMLPGTPVALAPDYSRFSDAKDGPLRPGKVGVVVAAGGGEARYKVMHLRTSATWFYDRRALRPLPGCMAAARCKRMKLNREGRAAFLGSDAGGGTGGDTGRSPRAIFYCGAALGQCRCGGCDGRCGPTNGCPCHACAELIGKKLTAEGGLVDGGSGAVDPALMQALLALAVLDDDDE